GGPIVLQPLHVQLFPIAAPRRRVPLDVCDSCGGQSGVAPTWGRAVRYHAPATPQGRRSRNAIRSTPARPPPTRLPTGCILCCHRCTTCSRSELTINLAPHHFCAASPLGAVLCPTSCFSQSSAPSKRALTAALAPGWVPPGRITPGAARRARS